ncbi:hypothetical protein COOONC_23798 [Cooperia oncophora]
MKIEFESCAAKMKYLLEVSLMVRTKSKLLSSAAPRLERSASASLRDRVASLNCAVVGLPSKPTSNNSLISNFSYLACGIGIFLGLLLCRRQLD